MRETTEIVKKETLKAALGTLILSAVMNLVFLVIGYWNPKVLFGSLLGAFTAILNFFLMCLSVKRSVDEGDKSKAVARMKSSQILRLLMVFAIIAIAAIFRKNCFNLIAAVIPLIFPSIIMGAIKLREAGKKNRENAGMLKPKAMSESEIFREKEAETGSEAEVISESNAFREKEAETGSEAEVISESEVFREKGAETGSEAKGEQD